MSLAPAEAGYVKLPLPTPFAVGDINAWLVRDDPLTLVDCGPNWAPAFEALERQLADLDLGIGDIERLVITHQHGDHGGLAGLIKRRSGCEVVMLDLLADQLADYPRHIKTDDDFTAAIMRRHGVAADVVTAIRAIVRPLSSWGSSVEADRRLADGDTLAFRDRSWTAHHRPGHSPTDTVFHDAGAGVLIAGDHVLSHISSNPLLSRPVGGASGAPDGPRPRSLMLYRESLAQTAAMAGVELVLGGHGGEVDKLVELLAGRERQTQRRAEKVHELLRADGPLTGHQLARAMWGELALQQPLLTMSEAVGHLDLLADRGEAVEDSSGPVSEWAAV